MREDKRCLLFEAGEGAERPGTCLRLRIPDGVVVVYSHINVCLVGLIL